MQVWHQNVTLSKVKIKVHLWQGMPSEGKLSINRVVLFIVLCIERWSQEAPQRIDRLTGMSVKSNTIFPNITAMQMVRVHRR